MNLTPQEKSVLTGFITMCLLGATIQCALHFNFRPVQWVNTASQAPDVLRKVKAPAKKKYKKVKHHDKNT